MDVAAGPLDGLDNGPQLSAEAGLHRANERRRAAELLPHAAEDDGPARTPQTRVGRLQATAIRPAPGQDASAAELPREVQEPVVEGGGAVGDVAEC